MAKFVVANIYGAHEALLLNESEAIFERGFVPLVEITGCDWPAKPTSHVFVKQRDTVTDSNHRHRLSTESHMESLRNIGTDPMISRMFTLYVRRTIVVPEGFRSVSSEEDQEAMWGTLFVDPNIFNVFQGGKTVRVLSRKVSLHGGDYTIDLDPDDPDSDVPARLWRLFLYDLGGGDLMHGSEFRHPTVRSIRREMRVSIGDKAITISHPAHVEGSEFKVYHNAMFLQQHARSWRPYSAELSSARSS
jgi:hypothetical protein